MFCRAGFPGRPSPANKVGIGIPDPIYSETSPTVGQKTVSDFDTTNFTVYGEVTKTDLHTSSQQVFLTISDGTSSNRLFMQKRNASGLSMRCAAQYGSTEIADPLLQGIPNGRIKFAITGNDSEVSFWVNGLCIVRLDNSYTGVNADEVHFGQLSAGSQTLSFTTAHDFRVYGRKFTDLEMGALTNNGEILSSITFNADRDLFVGLGQSNMTGQDSTTPTYTNASNIYALSNAGAVAAYSDPWDDPASSLLPVMDAASGEYDTGYMGYFASDLFDLTGRDVLVAPACQPSTGFRSSDEAWKIDSTVRRSSGSNIVHAGYMALAAFNTIQMARQHAPLKAILFGQGRSDVAAGTSEANYVSDYTALIDAIRGGVGLPNLHWFDLSLPNYFSGASQAAHDAITDGKSSMETTVQDFDYIQENEIDGNASDRTHYDDTGNQTVGDNTSAEVYAQLY